jgi:site-specific recombinase XerC
MLQDMRLRGLGGHTQQDYICHVRSFAAFLGRPPDTTSADELRRFQLDQHRRAVGPATINAVVSALHFLFTMTLKRPEIALGLSVIGCESKPRDVLSVEEAAPGVKYKAAFSVDYGAGLRVSKISTSRLETSTARA